MDRAQLHAFLSRPDMLGSGAPSQFTIPQLPIAYVIAPNGKADYTEQDAIAYVKAVKSKQVRRTGGRRRSTVNDPKETAIRA
jgi:hypothetical protein